MKKRILILTGLLIFCIKFNYCQTATIFVDMPWTKIINEETDSLGNERKTYISYKYSTSDTSHCYAFQIFTLLNDTLDGDFYEFSSTGKLLLWVEYKNRLLWNYKCYDSIRYHYGEIINGNGFIYAYKYAANIMGRGPIEGNTYCNNGIITLEEYYNKEGNVAWFRKNKTDKYYYFFNDNDELHYKASNISYSSDTSDIETYFRVKIQMHYFYECEDTTFYLIKNHYIVYSYEVDYEGTRLMPKDCYVPNRYNNNKRARFLRKYKRKCQRWYDKYNGFSEMYWDKYDEFLDKNEIR
jgi:hypothetical protein